MTKTISNSCPKIPKSGIFGTKFKDFYFFTKLCNKTNSRTQNSNMTILFWNSTTKICKSSIFDPKFKDFYFAPNFAIRQIQGRWFQTRQWLFWIPFRKFPNKTVFVLNVFFIFAWIFALKNSRALISKMAIAYFKFQQNIARYEIFFENTRIFF